MTEKKISIPFVLCLLLFFWTLIPLITGAFGVLDDFLFYSEYQSGSFWQDSLASAKSQGRFFQSFIMPLFFKMFPYFFNDLYFASAINLFLFGLDFVLLAYFLKAFFARENTSNGFYFMLLFLFVSVNIQGHYNPLTSYPVYFSFSLFLLLLSFLFAQQYKQAKSVLFYWCSVGLYFFVLLFCEMYLFYFFILFAILWEKPAFSFKAFLLHPIVPYVLVSLLYVLVYVAWRLVFIESATNSDYSGNRIDADISIVKVLSTTLSFSQSGAPLYFFFMDRDLLYNNSYLPGGHHQDLLYALSHAKISWLIKGILAALLSFMLLKTYRISSRTTLLIVLFVSIFFVFAPNLLISLTPKYIDWGQWENYYVYSFYSYLAFAVILVSLLLLLSSFINNKSARLIYCSVVGILFFIVSVTNDYINQHALISIHRAERCNDAVLEICKHPVFQSIPDGSIIVAPDLFHRFSDLHYFHWDENTLASYVKINASKNLVFRSTYDSSKAGNQYYIGYAQFFRSEDQFLSLSKITGRSDDSLLCSDLSLFTWPSYSPAAELLLRKQTGDSLWINDTLYPAQKGTNSYKLLDQEKEKNSTYTFLSIKGAGLYPQQLKVLPIDPTKGKPVKL